MSSRTLHVLIVEDDPVDADLAALALKREGLEIDWRRVDSEPAFTAALSDKTWDLIISDYAMPSFDGLRAFELARARAIDAPFIFVSGALGEARAVDAMRAGARDYVLKGDLRRLAAAVRREVHASEIRQRTRAAEDALARAHARQRSIFAASPTPLLCVDLSAFAAVVERREALTSLLAGSLAGLELATIVEANAAALELFGAERAAEIGPRLHGLMPRLVSELLNQVTLGVGGRCEFEYRFTSRSRGARDIVICARAPASLGELNDVVLSVFDVTERRALEARLHSAERLEAIGRLAGGVAHDFNNLLTVIGASADFLREGLQSDDERAEDVDAIVRTVAKAAALTKQLLAFSRRRPLPPVLVDLNAIIRETGTLLHRILGEDIEIVLRLAPVLATVLADPTHLEQIVMNLCTNARDALPNGGVLLLSTRELDVREGDAVEDPPLPVGSFVVLEVADNGTGMDEATRLRVFEPFFTSKAPGCGAGLGLATVDAVVAQSSGHIRVESTRGVGTAFRVFFPRQHGAATLPLDRPTPRRASRQHCTIALVEDEDALRLALRRHLERAGFVVIDARRAEDALPLILDHEGPIDVLVTDVVLPGMNGQVLAQRVADARPDVRVLFISGYNEIIAADHQQGSFSLLEKPFSASTLLDRIAQLLDAG